MAETGFDAGPKKLASSVGEFVGASEAYYAREFDKIQSATKFPWSWNTMAAVAGPLWGPARGLWGFFWTFIVLELLALVQIGRGLWGDLGADKVARAEKLIERSNALYEKGKVALQNSEPDAQGLITTAGNLKRAAARLMEQAELAAAEATTLLIIGLVVLVAVRVVEGFYANLAYEKRYLEWRGNPLVASGLNWQVAAFGAVLWLGIVPLTLYRFTVSKPLELITRFPMDKQVFTPVANEMEGWFDWLATHGAGIFDGITHSIRAVLAGLEVILVPGATGFLDTNYLGKAEYGLEALRHKDFLFLHVEATDEAGHMGAADKKVQALEDFDHKVVGTILAGLDRFAEWRLLLMPDHATPVAIKTHSDDPVPFAVVSSHEWQNATPRDVAYNESSAKQTGLVVPRAWDIMPRFIRGQAIGVDA